MRFRGGGVGHMYMRQVEPWLDATGWGSTLPSLEVKYPDSEHGPPPHDEGGDSNGAREDEDSEDDVDPGDIEDNDGEDPEQPDEDDPSGSDSDEDVNAGGKVNKQRGSRHGGGEASGDETEEEAEGDHL
jgi:hypothetical protein